MVEILVAMLVVSVGLLGVAGLHAYSLRNNYDALIRSHASALAGDIVDRMRANRDVALDATNPYTIGLTQTRTDPKTVADLDLVAWKTVLKDQLPDGDGAVTVNNVSRVVIITIQWGERGTTTSFSTQTEI